MFRWSKAGKWIVSTIVAMLGGGFAAGFAAMMDPEKYDIRHDFGSGKLWPYVFMGWALTFGGILMRSPIGKKVIAIAHYDEEAAEKLKEHAHGNPRTTDTERPE